MEPALLCRFVCEYADILQIGARNAELRSVACRRPIAASGLAQTRHEQFDGRVADVR